MVEGYDCSSPDSLREFMARYYPDYTDNLDLAKILCERWKRRSRESAAVKAYSRGGGYRRVKAREVRAGERVEIEGVVGEVDSFTYRGCPDKRKTGCRESEMRDWVVTKLYIEDDSGGVWAMTISESPLDVDADYIVRVRGYAKKWRDRVELSIHDLEVLAKPRVDAAPPARRDQPRQSSSDQHQQSECVEQLLSLVREVGEIDYDSFARALSRKCGLDESAIDSLPVETYRDRYGRVFVRLKQ